MAPIIETDIDAPLADTVLTVLKLAAEHHRGARTLDDVFRAVAVLNSYTPDEDVPDAYRRACTHALELLRRGERYLDAALSIPLRDFAACSERSRLLDNRAACEHEARTIIRRKITLEGPDL